MGNTLLAQPFLTDRDMSTDSPQSAKTLVLERAAEGDERAWEELVQAYSGRVYGLLFAQCRNPDLSEEITQSVFCTVASKLSGYSEVGKFEAWLFRIAINRLRDEMRRRKRHAVTMDDASLTGVADRTAAIEQETPGSHDDSETRNLQAALKQLGDEDRLILHLHYHGGLKFREIAEIVDRPIGTVLARQHRAIKRLRGLLEAASHQADRGEANE